MPKFLRSVILGLAVSCVVSCSDETNFNKLFVSQQQKDAIDNLVYWAQYHYDKGHFDDAKKYADKAYAINPVNEDVSVLLGYIHLSLGGIDTFQLTDRLMDQSKPTATTTKLTAASKDAADTLANLSDIIGMQDSEFALLGNRQDSSVTQFKNLPVYEPDSAEAARAAASKTVTNLNKAISYICPFVDSTALVEGDPRHVGCGQSPGTRKDLPKSDFLWALAHLGEAIAFNSVLLYKNPDASTPNLLARVSQFQTDTSLQGDIVAYATAAAELAEVVDKIFPTTDEGAKGSMLTALFNDLTAVSNAFAAIAGLPDNVKASIDKAIQDLQKKRDQLGQATDSNNAKALKQQLTKKATQQFKDSATKIASSSQFKTASAADQKKICDAYKQISNEVLTGCPK